MIAVNIRGHDLYEPIRMPVVPRKGDILVLGSLTGRSGMPDVIVSKVEWVRNQMDRFTDKENEGIHAWVTVRRVPRG